MNYLELLHSIPTELKRKFRKCENLKIKLINNLWSTTFNEMCIKDYLSDVFEAKTGITEEFRIFLGYY